MKGVYVGKGGGAYVGKGGKGEDCGKGKVKNSNASFSGKGFGGGKREEDTMEIVDERDIGKIIGKGGMNIRDLQDGTGCRIITPPKDVESEPGVPKIIKLQGTREAIKKCKEAIDGVLTGYEPKDVLAEIDGAVLMRNVDGMSIGHLGKVKSEIEQKHNVTLDLDARSARIWAKNGNRETAIAAKEAIDDILDDITTVETLTVPVPSHLVNQVINDTTLRQLQDQTAITANVAKDDAGTGIRLTGQAGAIQEAKNIIERRSQGEGSAFLPLLPGMFNRMSPMKWNEFQADLHHLMQNTGAKVIIGDPSNKAEFQGGPDEVLQAKTEVMKVLNFYFPQECIVIDLPPESVDWIAGPDDRELLRLQSQGATAALDRATATMWLCGNPKAVEMTRGRIRNSLERWNREHFFMQLDSKQQCFPIIGSGGSTIRELQSSTGARIDVDVNNCTVMISGKEESVKDAKRRILEITGGSGGRSRDHADGEHGGRGRGRGRGGRGDNGADGYDRGGGNVWGGGGGGRGGGGHNYAAPPAQEVAPPYMPVPAPVPEVDAGAAVARPRGRGRGATRW